MVSGKNVTFRENSMEKSPSPKRFEEPEGMTDIDLRRLSELSEYSDSSVKKFDPNTVRNTLFKILAVFLLVGFGTMVFVLIFRQEPIQKNPRILNTIPNYPRQEYWNHWNELSSDIPETSYFQQKNDETDMSENAKDIDFENNLMDTSYELTSPTNSKSQDHKEQLFGPYINIGIPDQNQDQSSILNNEINRDSTDTDTTSILNKNSVDKSSFIDNQNIISNELQNSIVDFVSLNMEQLQKCKFEQTVETCCVNIKSTINDSEPCNVKEIVDEIKKREEEFSRIQENWLHKLLDNDEIEEDFININSNDFDKTSNFLEEKNHQSSAQGEVHFSEFLKHSNLPSSLFPQNVQSLIQDKSINSKNKEYPTEQALNKFLNMLNLKDTDSSNQENSVKKLVPDFKSSELNLLHPEEVHIRTPNFDFDAYKINVNDPKISNFLDHPLDNFQNSINNNGDIVLENGLQNFKSNFLNKHDTSNELLGLVNIFRSNKKDSEKTLRDPMEIIFLDREMDDFDVVDFFNSFDKTLESIHNTRYLVDDQNNMEGNTADVQSTQTIDLVPIGKVSSHNEYENLHAAKDIFPFWNLDLKQELTPEYIDFQKLVKIPRENIDPLFTKISEIQKSSESSNDKGATFPTVMIYENTPISSTDKQISTNLAGKQPFDLIQLDPKILEGNSIHLPPDKTSKQPIINFEDLLQDPTVNYILQQILSDYEDHLINNEQYITTTPKNQIRTKQFQIKSDAQLNENPELNVGTKLNKMEDALVTKFSEISGNIGDKFRSLTEKIKPAVQEIKTNLISNYHDLEHKIEPKLEALKNFPQIVVEGTGKVLEQIKENIGLTTPDEKHKLQNSATNGFHINIDPLSIFNGLDPNILGNDIEDNGILSKEEENLEKSSVNPNLKDLKNVPIMAKSSEYTFPKNGVMLQIIQKNQNSLSPIIINENTKGNNDDKTEEAVECSSEDKMTEYSSYETTAVSEYSSYETTAVTETSSSAGPLQVTTTILKMDKPDIDETDVTLYLKETNTNVTYTNPKKIKRQAQQYEYPNVEPEQKPYPLLQSENVPHYYQNSPQNAFGMNNDQQHVLNYNYHNNFANVHDQYGEEHVYRNHEQNHFRHHGQFDYRGEKELGLDTQNVPLGMFNNMPRDQQGNIISQNTEMHQEVRGNLNYHHNGFHPNIHQQQKQSFEPSSNEFRDTNVPQPNQKNSNDYIFQATPKLSQQSQTNLGIRPLQQNEANFIMATHQVNPPGSKVNPVGSGHHQRTENFNDRRIIEPMPALNQKSQNNFEKHLSQQEHDGNLFSANHNINSPGTIHKYDYSGYIQSSLTGDQRSEATPSSNQPSSNRLGDYMSEPRYNENLDEVNSFGSPVSFELKLPKIIEDKHLSDERRFNEGTEIDAIPSKGAYPIISNEREGENKNVELDFRSSSAIGNSSLDWFNSTMEADNRFNESAVQNLQNGEEIIPQSNKSESFSNKLTHAPIGRESNTTQFISNQAKSPNYIDNQHLVSESIFDRKSSGPKPVFYVKTENDTTRSDFQGNQLGSQPTQPTMNQRISAETKIGQFNSASEDIQSSHHSSLNPNFQKQCIPISPPVGSSLSVIQQQMPYPYDPNLKFTQLIPVNVPKPQANSFVINPPYTYVTPNIPQPINSYGTLFSNGQTSVVQQVRPSGQYYICNPITSPNNQVAGIPGVEVRQSDPLLMATSNKNLTTRESDICATGYELCADNSKCIKTERICDGEVNCDDGSDEVYCSCKYRLGPSRWCDGYYDCPNGEDEVGCFGCEAGFFNCDDWSYSHGSTCIPIYLRCNGVPDCPTGVDEQECSALLDTIETSDDLFKVSNNAGFLHRNFEGKWYPVCTNPEYWALDACKYETGPSVIPPLTRLVPLEHQYTGEYASAGEDNEIHLATKCLEKRAVYVECPQPTCGIRWQYRNAYRREEVDTSAEEIAARFSVRSKREHDDRKVVDDLNPESSNHTTLKEEIHSPRGILGDGRVVGGKPCQPGAWPWVVSIYKNGAFHCGGVLISDMWLMTAAHCTEKYWLYFYEIELGMLRRFSYSPMQQTRYVTDVISHPGYERSNLKNDLAMMRLNHPVKFNRYVRPICLPNEYTAGYYYQNGPLPGTVCTAVGWGATVEHGSDPDHMREVEVPVLPKCKHKEDEEGNEICAGLMEGGKDACQGDSGGPFLCRNPNMPEQWYLAGIVSHGEGCARPNEPGVYTKVAIYRDWIFENAKDDMLPQRKPLHHCPGYTCKAINKCIPKKRRCDRVIDCLNGDDEIDCEHGNSFSSLFKHAMRHMMFSYDGLSRSNVETPGNPQTAEAVPKDKIATTFKMENSPITDTLNGNGFAQDDSSFASPAPISDRDKFISNAEAATATSVDVTTEKESVDESPEESISLATVSNKEDATQPAKTDVNSTVMMKSFKGERFLCRKMLEVIPAEKKCDKTIDCQDGTDEESCACADYLKHSHPEAICDGVTDCADLSDEKECNASCGGGHFYCRLSKACIPIEKKCDNRPDCGRNEDEWDCFTLADSHRVLLDADSRPALLRSGLLAFNKGDQWVPLCMNYTGIEGRIAADACVTQGFNDYEKYLQVEVPNRILRIGKEDEIVGMDEKLESCNALYIKCADVSVSGHEIGKEDRLNVAGELHTPPWNAAVYADGEYKCAGTVLNLNWILTSVNCFPGILKLHQHYVAVLMGAHKGYLHVGGPHEQVIPVTEVARVLDTEVVLLRLKKKLRFTRYVHPLHFKRTGDFVRHREACVALGRDSDQKSSSVLLRPVQNCTAGFRCFKRLEETSPECKVSDAADPWSGCVVCDSGSGFYPAAVFHEPKGRCGFSGSVSLPNIALLKRDLFQYIEKAEVLVQPPPCKGFRCNLGECIQAQSLCNGIPDCRDSADEDHAVCAEFKRNCHLTDSCYCSPSEMRCANGNCVSKDLFCDQIDDCGDGSDEPDICNCQTYLRLANSSKICDGVRNCLDRSDEDPTLCKCSAGQFKCGESSYCIPNDMVCDGRKDCPGNEDEVKCLTLQSPDDNFNIGEVLTCTYGVWHPGCFPEHLTTTELEEICKKIGFSGNSASYLNTTSPSTGRPVLDPFNSFWVHRGTGNSRIRLSLRSGVKNFVSFVDDPGCHRLFLRCL